jgi:hypothetical protein
MKVQDVMTAPVVTVSATTHYKEIVELLLTWDISGLPVVDFDGQLVGIVTEADLLPRQGDPHHRPRALAVVADVVSGLTGCAGGSRDPNSSLSTAHGDGGSPDELTDTAGVRHGSRPARARRGWASWAQAQRGDTR